MFFIFELKKEEFNIIRPIVNTNFDYVEVHAVIDGTNPGWIFTDSLTNPKTALVWSQGVQGFYFVGDCNNTSFNNKINDFIDFELIPRLQTLSLKDFEFSGDSKEWSKTFGEIFTKRNLKKSTQFVYKLHIDSWKKYIPRKLQEEYTLRKIDKHLLWDENIKNLDYLKSELTLWWDSLDSYLSCDLGYCIVKEDEILSFCMCDYIHKNLRPLGIETREEHRRKGLCEAITYNYIKDCISKNLLPYWDCMGKNFPSQKLAEKLGLRKVHEYDLFWF